MKYLFFIILLVILIDSCAMPVSVEEINTIPECENTKFVKNLRGISHTLIYIGDEYMGTYSEWEIVDNYFIVTGEWDNTSRYYLCNLISAEVSGYHLILRF